MAKECTMSRPSTPKSADGFSLVELLVAMTVTLVVTGVALSLVLSGRGLYEADQARTRLNQNLRSAKGFLVADIRQAGEGLGEDFPVLEIVDGSSGASDELAVRRIVEDTVLRVCRDVNDGDTEVYIGEPDNPPPPGCAEVPDGDGDGWPDNLQAWREYRLNNGPAVRAYIYNPATGNGEFFVYDGEDDDELVLQASASTWTYSYTEAENCRIYLLEERRYQLSNNVLQLILNGDADNPLHLVDGFEDFQAVALFQDGSAQAALGSGDTWADLRAIRVTLDGNVPVDDRAVQRSWSAEVLPRNVLSK